MRRRLRPTPTPTIDSLYLTEDSQDFSREEKPVLYPIFRVFLDYYTLL
jgi:hypothetical protein